VEVESESAGQPFRARTDGPAYRALASALREAYGKDMVQSGQGGSIPLCNVLAAQFPEAEIALIGVEEPGCLIHAPNESVDPSEIEHMALAEALFLSSYATPL
jgi:acetylornithine deacetylase/succinyl-diaminopimelate desuccinylase-like protein